VNRIQPLLHACGHDHELHGATVQHWEPILAPQQQPVEAPRDEVRAPSRWRRWVPAAAKGSGRRAGTSGRAAQLLGMSGQTRESDAAQEPQQGRRQGKSKEQERRGGRERQAPDRPQVQAPAAEAAPPKPRRGVHVNAAICNSKYQPVQLPVVVDLLAKQRRRPARRRRSEQGDAERGSELRRLGT